MGFNRTDSTSASSTNSVVNINDQSDVPLLIQDMPSTVVILTTLEGHQTNKTFKHEQNT